MKNKKRVAKIISRVSITILLIVNSFWFVFALLSGAEEYGGGAMGIIKNSPNAIPWLIIFGVIYCAWKWKLIGGLIISLLGLFTAFFFDTYEEPIVFLLIPLPLIIMGILLIYSWYLLKK